MSGRHRRFKHVGHRRIICLGKNETTNELVDISELGIRLTKRKSVSNQAGNRLSKISFLFFPRALRISYLLRRT